ncbi:MAG: fibronectin type III domain-containing protein, partial [Trebonia sp.]
HPITERNAGTVVPLPPAGPLDQTRPRTQPAAVSYIDGNSGQTTYHYHAPLKDLEPETTYYYQVSDGPRRPPPRAPPSPPRHGDGSSSASPALGTSRSLPLPAAPRVRRWVLMPRTPATSR